MRVNQWLSTRFALSEKFFLASHCFKDSPRGSVDLASKSDGCFLRDVHQIRKRWFAEPNRRHGIFKTEGPISGRVQLYLQAGRVLVRNTAMAGRPAHHPRQLRSAVPMYPGDAGFRAAARESLTFSACGYQSTDVCVVDLETKKVTKSAEINKGINSSMFVTFG